MPSLYSAVIYSLSSYILLLLGFIFLFVTARYILIISLMAFDARPARIVWLERLGYDKSSVTKTKDEQNGVWDDVTGNILGQGLLKLL